MLVDAKTVTEQRTELHATAIYFIILKEL